MSAKQARMKRRMMAGIEQLEERPYQHIQLNLNPIIWPTPAEDETDAVKEQVRQHNEEQKYLYFKSKIDPKRRLRRFARSINVPMPLLIMHLFGPKVSVTEETSTEAVNQQ